MFVRILRTDVLPRLLSLCLLIAALLRVSADAAPLSGTKTVGPTGDYASITAAIADVQAAGNGLGGALILELQASYVSAVETFPLTIPALNGASATNTLTLRPASGATALTITSADTTAATVDLNGAQFVTIDGRPGGVGSNAGSGGGTASQLTIANTSTSGRAVRFINEASGNTVRYVTFRGVGDTSGASTLLFGTTTGVNGNDNNTIDHCDIRDGAGTPAFGIFSFGSTGTIAQGNSGNTVSNCNVYNFHLPSNTAAGVWLHGGNTDWTITGCSFYQTSARTAGMWTVNAICINNTSGNNFTVTGNAIGGSAPGAGGTAWTTTGTTAPYLFQGIRLNVGNAVASSVQGNTIGNIVWTSSSTAGALPGVWSGIYVQAGAVNIGTVAGNTIGDGVGTGSVSVTTSGSGGTTFGISSASSGTVSICNNTVGSITTNGSDTGISASLYGIRVTAGINTISNNAIGSAVTVNSLNAATPSTAYFTQQAVVGIGSSSNSSVTITANTVANLNNNYNASGVGASVGFVNGIFASSGVNTIVGNTVRNLTSTSQNADLLSFPSFAGIVQTSSFPGQNISQNVVHSLVGPAASGSFVVTGMYCSSGTTGVNVFARNLVHSLGAPSLVVGMVFANGSFTAQNNMVRVGLDASGAGTAGTPVVYGLLDWGTTAGRNFHHNSVFVGGTQTSGASGSFAFVSAGTSNARTFRDNIFVNFRGNSGAVTGTHYAVAYGGTTANPAGLAASNNIFFAGGAGGMLGQYNSADISTLSAWQSATGVDSATLYADPLFSNPTGDATSVDLHIQAGSPASNAGASGTGVTTDFDGQLRSATLPFIGADEIPSGNADLSGLVLSAGGLSPVFAANTLDYTASVSNSTGTLSFTPSLSSGVASVTVNGASAATPVTLTVGSGNVVSIVATATDGTTKTYTVTVTRRTVFQDWAVANAVSSDPSVAGANTAMNLQNFAFGMDPNSGASGALVFNGTFGAGGTIGASGLPITRMEGADARALFLRRKDFATAGLTYTVRFSSDLSNWQDSTDTPIVLADDGTNQIVSVPYPAGWAAGGFFRVRVSIP